MEGGAWLPSGEVELRQVPAAPNEALPEKAVLEGRYQEHNVLLQHVACPSEEWSDGAVGLAEAQIEQLRSLSKIEKGVADVLGLYRENEENEDVYLVLQRPDGALSLRNYLQQRGEVTWNERLNIAEKVVDIATVMEENLPCPPTVDSRSILVTDDKQIRLAGIRASKKAKLTRDVSFDVGLLLVELMTKQPPVRSSDEGSLIEFPSTAQSNPSPLPSPRGQAPSLIVTPPPSPRSSGLLDASSPQSASASAINRSRRRSLRLSTGVLDLSSSGTYTRKDAAAKDRNWEKVQKMAFTAWMNSYLSQRDLAIIDLQNDLRDGVLLNSFLEIISNKPLKRRWNKKPINQISMRENLGLGLAHIQHDMGIKLVGIGAEDIYDANMKLILGLVWSLFKALQTLRIARGEGSMEEGLMQWVRDCAAEVSADIDLYAEDKTTSFFKNAFRDGKLFAAILAKHDPEKTIDFTELTENKTPEELLPIVFQLVEERFKVPRLLEPADLLGDDPDERAVQLYVSLIFDALHKDAAKLPISSGDDHQRIQIPENCPPGLIELAKACCSSNPDERPSLEDIRQRIRDSLSALEKEQSEKKEQENTEKAPQPVASVADGEGSTAKLLERLRRKKSKIKDLSSKLNEKETTVLSAAKEIEQLNERGQIAEAKANAQEEQMNELRLRFESETSELKKRTEEQESQLSQLHERLRASEQALAEEKAQLEAARESAQNELKKQADERAQVEQELQKQIEELRATHEEAMGHEKQAKEDLEEQLRKIQNEDRSVQLEDQLKSSSERAEKLEQELEAMKRQAEEASSRSEDATKQAEEKDRLIADIKTEKEQKEKELEEMINRAMEAEKQAAERNEEIVALTKARDGDQEKIAQLTATLSAKTDADRTEELSRENEELKQMLKREQEAAQLKQSELDDLASKLSSMQESSANAEKLRQDNEALKGALEEMKQALAIEIEALKETLEDEQQRGKLKDGEIALLRDNALKEQEASADKLRQENESLLKQIDDLKLEVERQREQAHLKQSEIDSLTDQLAHLQQTAANAEKMCQENESLKGALEEMKQALEFNRESKQGEIDLLTQKLANLQNDSADAEKLRQEVESLKEALGKSQQSMHDVEAALQREQQERSEEKQQNERAVAAERERHQNEAQALREQLDSLRSEQQIEQLRSEGEAARRRNDEEKQAQQREMETLRQELDAMRKPTDEEAKHPEPPQAIPHEPRQDAKQAFKSELENRLRLRMPGARTQTPAVEPENERPPQAEIVAAPLYDKPINPEAVPEPAGRLVSKNKDRPMQPLKRRPSRFDRGNKMTPRQPEDEADVLPEEAVMAGGGDNIGELQTLKEKLDKTLEELNQAHQAKDDVLRQLDKLKEDLRNADEREQQHRAELEQARMAAQGEINELKAEYERKLQEERAEHVAQIEAAERNLASKQADEANLQEEIDRLREDLNATTAQLDSRATEYEDQKRVWAETEATLTRDKQELAEELDNMKQRMQEIEGQAERTDTPQIHAEELQRLEAQIATLNERIAQGSAKRETERQEVEELRKRVKQYESEAEEAERIASRVRTLEEENKRLLGDIEALEDRHKEALQQYHKPELELELQRLREELEQVKRSEEEKSKPAIEMVERGEAAQRELEELKEKYNQETKRLLIEKEEVIAQLNEMKQQLEQARDQSERALHAAADVHEKDKEKWKAEREELEADIEQLQRNAKGQSDEQEQERVQLRADLERISAELEREQLDKLRLQELVDKMQAERREIEPQDLRSALEDAERDKRLAADRANKLEDTRRQLEREVMLAREDAERLESANKALEQRVRDLELAEEERQKPQPVHKVEEVTRPDEDMLTKLSRDMEKMKALSRGLQLHGRGIAAEGEPIDAYEDEDEAALAESSSVPVIRAPLSKRRNSLAGACLPSLLWIALLVAVFLLMLLVHKADFIKDWWVPT